MFGLFTKRHNRVDIKGDNIFIDNQTANIGKAIELETVFKLMVPTHALRSFQLRSYILSLAAAIIHFKKNWVIAPQSSEHTSVPTAIRRHNTPKLRGTP